MTALPDYAELQCVSNFSFLTGASTAEELVERATRLGYTALAITDECSLAGVVRAHVAAKQAGLQLIVGATFRVAGSDAPPDPDASSSVCLGVRPEDCGAPLTITALARHRDGYGNLCELISLARLRSPKGHYHLTCQDLALLDPAEAQPLFQSTQFAGSQAQPDRKTPVDSGVRSDRPLVLPKPAASDQQADFSPFAAPSLDHLRGLPGCWVILSPDYPADEAVLDEQIRWAKRTFGAALRVALTLHAHAWDDVHRGRVARVAARHDVPLVATGWPLMHARSRKPLQDLLTAIRLGTPVDRCGYALQSNAERHLRSRLRLANLYPAQALAETVRLAQGCHFSLDQLRYEYPEELVPAGLSPSTHLRQETLKGAQRRFPNGIPPVILDQIERELQLIADLRYEAYFLTVYDLVQYARSRNILCQGRGSAANSAVCYCLGITEVDPARANLLFERFISKERNEPPDIDVDFEHQRREEVMQYLYRKYGRHRAALTAAVATYRPRGALRDAGKALGVPAAVIDRVTRGYRRFDGHGDFLQRLIDVGLDVEDDAGPDADAGAAIRGPVELSADARRHRQWAALATQLLGYPRHLSQHSGGFVISRGPLTRLVPVENAAMAGRTVIQWDKDDIEALGLLKVDVLALGMLSMLHRALDLLSGKRGRPFALQDIPAEDPATYDMLCRGEAIGVFQVESRAQMAMLPRLRPRCFYDLVIEIAIVRPGPMQGGMVHPYLRRRNGVEPVTFPSAALEQALARTLGVPIFQEQVMQIAIKAAGYSPGEADQLRRAMAAWKRHGNIGIHRDRLVGGLLANGYDRVFAEGIFAQIHGFGEYGFPESHAASFALLAYASAWLRCHEPAVFLTALLNSQPMGFYTPAQLVQDARRRGVVVRPVDVAVSQWDSDLEAPNSVPAPAGGSVGTGGGNAATGPAQDAVRLGFSRIAGMRQAAAERIVQARSRKRFVDVADLAHRARLDRHDLQVLAQADALRTLAGDNRRAALWQAAAAVPDRDLLRGTARDDADPALPSPTEGQAIVADYRALGLTLGRHPVALLRDRLQADRLLSAAQLAGLRNRQLARACGLVTVRQRPQTAKGVVFMTLEDETGPINVILWSDVFKQYRREALGAPLLAVYGVWQTDGSVHHLIAKRLVDRSELLTEVLSGLGAPSRDFC